ncbi:glycoprotein hormone alpha-2 isoform X1 [Pongo abelii]|uniref:glycoprotein hormone alpha-2 isoform X1 n=1 Tax=Pongo abelii TaxID=9601 RepID=UPI0023E8AB7A|nr:glycoprotein hormone alpha-2 isoform X1 [Pongo abelii]
MLANKSLESQHQAGDQQEAQENSKPLCSWASEVMPMASPQTLVLCLLVLAVTEAWGQEAVIPGCHLHREYLWDQRARRSGGSGWEQRADRVDGGAGSTLEGPTLRHRQQELGRGKPWQRRRLLLAYLLLAFNVTVRSDRQGTCQGSHVAQACVGHCESSAFPSRYSVLVASGYRHNITSVSQCCTISGLKKVKVQLQCVGSRREEIEIFTARACQCDMCRLSRY